MQQCWTAVAGAALGLLVLAMASRADEAAAVKASGPAAEDKEVERLVKQLGSDDFKEREEATKRLKEIGAPALDALHKAKTSDDREVRRRAEEVVTAIEAPVKAIKELKEKRLVLLVKVHEGALMLWQAGDAKITFDHVRQTKADLLAARLDLAEKKEDRIKICEEAVKSAEAWEKSVAERVATGIESAIRTLQAQAYVLETRIILEKAKAAK